MFLRSVQFFALLLTALALVPVGAHFFELPGKIDLTQADYLTVQQIYRGWSHFGVVLIGAITVTFLLTVLRRRQRAHLLFAGAAFVLISATLVVFFTWTYPANQATQNWTLAPENWQSLRRQWEYAHAVDAALTFAAFCALLIEALLPRRAPGRGQSIAL